MALIEFERTPNPDAIRILPGQTLCEGSPRQFLKGYGTADPLAAALLRIDGIIRVLIGRDFVTAVRDGPRRSWDDLRAELAFALSDQLERRVDAAMAEEVRERELLGDIELQIEEVLDRWVRPLLAADGGEAVLVRFDPTDGTAWIRMDGACGGCPSSSLTLKRGIEQSIRKWVPEVSRVIAAPPEAPTESDPKARFRNWIAAKFGSRANGGS